MSSPKRYLWSQEPTKQPWRLNYHSAGGDTEPLRRAGTLCRPHQRSGRAAASAGGRQSQQAAGHGSPLLPQQPLHVRFGGDLPPRHHHDQFAGPPAAAAELRESPAAGPHHHDDSLGPLLAERRILHIRAHAARDLAYRLLRMIGGEDMPLPEDPRLSDRSQRGAGEGQCRSAADPVRMGRSQRDPGRLHVYADRPEFCRPCRRLLRRHAPGRRRHAEVAPVATLDIGGRATTSSSSTIAMTAPTPIRPSFPAATSARASHRPGRRRPPCDPGRVLRPSDAAEAAGVPSGSPSIASSSGAVPPDRA